MAKVIIIGNLKGTDVWRKIKEKHPDAHLYFLGDYISEEYAIPIKKQISNLYSIIDRGRRNGTIQLHVSKRDLEAFGLKGFYGNRSCIIPKQHLLELTSQFGIYNNASSFICSNKGLSNNWVYYRCPDYIKSFSSGIFLSTVIEKGFLQFLNYNYEKNTDLPEFNLDSLQSPLFIDQQALCSNPLKYKHQIVTSDTPIPKVRDFKLDYHAEHIIFVGDATEEYIVLENSKWWVEKNDI